MQRETSFKNKNREVVLGYKIRFKNYTSQLQNNIYLSLSHSHLSDTRAFTDEEEVEVGEVVVHPGSRDEGQRADGYTKHVP